MPAGLDRSAEQFARRRVDDLHESRRVKGYDAFLETIQNGRQAATLPLDDCECDGEALTHLIDALREPSDVVGEPICDGLVEIAAGDRPRRHCEPSHASRYERGDREADDDGKGHRDQRPEDEPAAQRIAGALCETGSGRICHERRRRAVPGACGESHDARRRPLAGRHEAAASERDADRSRRVGQAPERHAWERRGGDDLPSLIDQPE